MSGASAVQPPSNVTAGAAAVNVPAATGAGAGGAASQSSVPDEPASVKAFDELIEGPVAAYQALSQELGGVIAEQVTH